MSYPISETWWYANRDGDGYDIGSGDVVIIVVKNPSGDDEGDAWALKQAQAIVGWNNYERGRTP